MTTRFLLVRHAMTDANGVRLAGRMPDVHLNAEGRGQAAALATRLAHLPVAALHASPMERAQETAAPLAAVLGCEVVADAAFHEIDFGDWTGRSLEDLARDPHFTRFNAFRSGTPVPGGESMPEVQARMVRGLAALRERRPDECVLVVSHGDPIRAAVAFHVGIPLDLLHRIEVSPASVTVLDVDEWGARLVALNECLGLAHG